MEKRLFKLIIVVILCLIPASMAYEANAELEFSKKVAYAMCFYFVFLFPLWSIIRLSDSEYRLNAPNSEIIERWMDIVVFPISFLFFRGYFSDDPKEIGAGPVGIVWVSFIIAITISGLVGRIIKYFVNK